jgi:O-6-methylguanine DNA methyltransferase
MKKWQIPSPLGPILACADESALVSLTFSEEKGNFEKNRVLEQLEEELALYFAGKLQAFQTPVSPSGTDFQKRVWQALQKIPYGKTCSYGELAQELGHEKAFRAVARANGANPIAILVPCHRVIYADQRLGGYSSGIAKKIKLLNLEGIKHIIFR